MATHRSRRLRKKLCVDEFQELGFELSFQYREEIGEAGIDDFMQRFAGLAVEPNDLVYSGCDEYGFICLARRGSVSEQQREWIEGWLKQQPELAGFKVSPLMDAWYPDQPVNPTAPRA
ncbi:YggL family protein [Pseudomonas sp. Pseusp97]|uniref:YggL 50S ribosome-binding family protein n=1 Tax=Pseudomonas sp. Pseusp97 TaxID=3243065 RepID=UPI0039A47D05